MTNTGAAAELKANIEMHPMHSQVLLVALSVIAAICIICSAILIATGLASGWIFLLFAALTLVGVYLLWVKSQSDIDLQGAHPTQIALANGTTFSTDSRILRSPEGVRGVAKLCDEILSRHPLPNPDGLVDTYAQPIPDSKNEAIAYANNINRTTQIATNEVIDVLGLGNASPKNLNIQTAGTTENEPDEVLLQSLNTSIVDSSD
ncbi:MAG: hypothetical protein PHP57_11345 [Sideroxydans sp.]|nr:hypothetical protein [Sideroxydans sp.]